MLFFLNIYSANSTRKSIFQAKCEALLDKAQLISSSFSNADGITSENAAQVMALLGNLSVDRIMIMDSTGMAQYDSLLQRSAKGKYILLQECVLAMEEKTDVVNCRYTDGAILSFGAIPIMQYGASMGCVYIADEDLEQGSIIQSLEQMVFRISIGIEAVLILFSMLFATISSVKMRRIMVSMQKVREGKYDHKIRLHGTDEYSRVAIEFNRLTDRLEASERAQRQFVSDASHELKTPLASIKLLSDSILQNDMDPDTMREFVSDIGSEADRLTRMTQKLLAISRAELVNQDHEIVDLSAVVSRVFKMLITMADQMQIRLTSHMVKDCTVMTVEDDMYQIIFNLVENAIKYNYAGGQVHVRLQRAGDDVKIVVEDTGIGIPTDAIDHIFERFFRVDKARSRQAGGSGLGLSIVYELVQRNYGKIYVEQRKEGGSRFTVMFPVFEVEI